MGYPTKTTLAIAVDKGNLSSFPGALTSAQINKYYFILEPSVKGHLPRRDKVYNLLLYNSVVNLPIYHHPVPPMMLSPHDSILQQISYLPPAFSVLVRFLAISLGALLLLLSTVTIIFLLFTVMIAIRSTLLLYH